MISAYIVVTKMQILFHFCHLKRKANAKNKIISFTVYFLPKGASYVLDTICQRNHKSTGK